MHGASLAVVEQDSIDDVTQCVRVICSTPQGSRTDDPELGVPDQTFAQGGADPDAIVDAVARSEERAEIEIDATLDERELAQGRDRLAVRVALAGEG
jgi:phage baseplate assembly protein W